MKTKEKKDKKMIKDTEKQIEYFDGKTTYGTYIESCVIEEILNLKKGQLDEDTTQIIVDKVYLDDSVINDYVCEELPYYKEEILEELGLEEKD